MVARGALADGVVIAHVPFVAVHVGVPHTAYRVVLVVGHVNCELPEVAFEVFAQPKNILLPLVMLQVLLFHEGNVVELLLVQVMLPLVVPVAPPHVPEPPFLFNVIVFVFALQSDAASWSVWVVVFGVE